MQNAEKIIILLKKEYPRTKYYLNFSNPLELLVAAILSAQVRILLIRTLSGSLIGLD